MSGCWNQFFLIFLSVNQWKGKVLAGPFGLEHLVLILLSWQALALCMEETLCTSAPVHSPAMGCTLGCTLWLDSPWEKRPLFTLNSNSLLFPSDAPTVPFSLNVIMCLPESEPTLWCAWLPPMGQVGTALFSFWQSHRWGSEWNDQDITQMVNVGQWGPLLLWGS